MISKSNGSMHMYGFGLSKVIHVFARKCGAECQLELPRRWQVRRVRVKLAVVVTRVACSVAGEGGSATRAGIDAPLFDKKPAPARTEGRGQALGCPVREIETRG